MSIYQIKSITCPLGGTIDPLFLSKSNGKAIILKINLFYATPIFYRAVHVPKCNFLKCIADCLALNQFIPECIANTSIIAFGNYDKVY